ncbi:MAG: glycosyltransferase family 4 protein [Bacteroides sp.]|nr:glycosyltransferase family 4 protein [Bacteroides sp.]
MGSLIKRKGFDILIKAFEESGLKDVAEVIIVGNGPEKIRLQKQIDSANLQQVIKLVGKKTKKEITELLCGSHVFVFPSRNENFSVAVLEALSFGLPVVATVCGGIKECIQKDNGILVAVDNVSDFAKALKKVHANIHTFDRKSIAEDCRKKYSPTVVAQQITDIYQYTINLKSGNV